jgi:hypothetical protein
MDLAVVVVAENQSMQASIHQLVPLAPMAEVLGLELIQLVPVMVLL